MSAEAVDYITYTTNSNLPKPQPPISRPNLNYPNPPHFTNLTPLTTPPQHLLAALLLLLLLHQASNAACPPSPSSPPDAPLPDAAPVSQVAHDLHHHRQYVASSAPRALFVWMSRLPPGRITTRDSGCVMTLHQLTSNGTQHPMLNSNRNTKSQRQIFLPPLKSPPPRCKPL